MKASLNVSTVYLSLGSNIGDSRKTLRKTISTIRKNPYIYNVRQARFYLTTPVEMGPNSRHFVNTALRLETNLTADIFLDKMQEIEGKLGKTLKPFRAGNCSRVIDIDILFFGTEAHNNPRLTVPHPRWTQRLFVLVPLSDLTNEIEIPGEEDGSPVKVSIKKLINDHPGDQSQTIKRLTATALGPRPKRPTPARIRAALSESVVSWKMLPFLDSKSVQIRG